MSRSLNSIAGLRFSVVGAGRVGVSMSSWAAASGALPSAVGGRSPGASAQQLALHLGCSRVPLETLTSGSDDLLLLAVSDPALEEVAARLAERPQARVVLHTSGSRGASALAPLRSGGSAVGSLHPLKAFPQPLPQLEEARGTVFGVDGDPPALELARLLARSWDAIPVEVVEAARPVYHLAASVAAGGVVTLVALAAELAERAGVGREVTAGYLELARGAIAQAAASSDLPSAITGPVARGDCETVLWELEEVRQVAPLHLPLVLCLARETVAQAARGRQPSPTLRDLAKDLETFDGDD